MKTIKEYLSYIYHSCKEYGFDARRYISQSLISGYAKNEQSFLGYLTLHAHAVEKGIAMPNRRLHFGEQNVSKLIALCEEYSRCYDTSRTLFKSSVEVLFEYAKLHQDNGVTLPEVISEGIKRLHLQFPDIKASVQPVMTKKQMYCHGDFEYVANHRHSVRNFAGKVDEERLKAALELAGRAPSSCNRQQSRVHVIGRGMLFDNVLSLQLGNRGFGNQADKLLVVTTELASYNGLREKNLPYVDGGIFVMNLLYALQYNGIAACTLNSCFQEEDEKKMQKLLKTQDAFIAIIAIGDCPEETLVVQSPRIHPNEYIINH